MKHYPAKIAVTNAPKFWRTVGATKNSPAGIANGGYWGIRVKPNTT